MKRFLAGFILLFSCGFSFAQDFAVDSKGEPVLQLYSKDNAVFQFTRRAPISFSYVFGKKGKGEVNNSGLLLQVSVLNSGDFPLVEKLRDVRPGGGLKLGYQQNTGALSKLIVSGGSAWGVNAIFNVDNIQLYDTVKASISKEYPLTYGAEGHYTVFFKSKGSSGFSRALSIYSSVTSTWDDRNIISYQDADAVRFRPDVVAMRDFDGRYGVLEKNFLKSRTVVSFPMFYGKFNPTPYVAAIFGTQNSPSYHMGVMANILSSSLQAADNKLPSAFGIGFDWVYATEHLSSKVNVFVKASVSIGRLKR